MAQYGRDRTVRAGRIDPGKLGRLVVAGFDSAPGYEALDLAPVEPLGANSLLTTIDQNNILATVRGTEVVADPTVLLALEAAVRRRQGVDVVRLCAAHRVVRQQAFEPPAPQHFRLFALVTGAARNRITARRSTRSGSMFRPTSRSWRLHATSAPP